jgi:hypothetical protein
MAARKSITLIAHPIAEQGRFQGERAPAVRFDSELAEYICEQIAMKRSLLSICREKNMPTAAAVIYWSTKNIGGFRKMYQDACSIRASLLAEELIDIVDDSFNDYVERETKEGGRIVVFDGEHVQRSKLRFEARKWVISKLLSGVYGDSTLIKLADNEGKKLQQPPLLVAQPVAPEPPKDA